MCVTFIKQSHKDTEIADAQGAQEVTVCQRERLAWTLHLKMGKKSFFLSPVDKTVLLLLLNDFGKNLWVKTMPFPPTGSHWLFLFLLA